MDSIWTDSAHIPAFESLHGDITTDVLVIGGGMAGILCAYWLKASGVDCALVEADRIGMGITKNTTAKITSQHGLVYHKLLKRFGAEKTKLYLKANEEALEAFRKLCAGIDCGFETRDHFVYEKTRSGELVQELSVLEALGYPGKFVPDLPLPFPTVGGIKFPRQAQFHPLAFLAGLVRDLPIYESTRVTELAPGFAKTEQGSIRAEKIIIATHFPFLNKHGSFFLKLYQQRSYVLALENGPKIEGMYLDAAENGLSFRMFGDKLLLGGGGHRTGKPGGGWWEVEAAAARYYPEAVITHRWATQDCMSLDGIPYIGQYSRSTPNLYVATGFNKWGMTSSMVSALLLKDLMLGRENPYRELFSPSRSMLRPQLGLNMLESTRNLVSFSTPRCPHLGCALKWNKHEHSWDCPCHGSRFREDGKLIDNPATGDLKRDP